jgi:Fe-S-cluster formation regulator IscX/YfhJ
MMRLVQPHQLFVAIEAFLDEGQRGHGRILRCRLASTDF